MIVRDLYGPKTAGDSFHKQFEIRIRDLGLKPILEDLDTCTKPSVNQCGYKYYEYVTTWIYIG